jgi:dTDP-4-dehydrorhamnose reductase
VWVTGAGGLIGNCLVRTARDCAPGWEVRGLRRADLDLLDLAAVRRQFREQAPQAIVHCAAMSNTAACQSNPDLARRVNVEVTALLAELTRDAPFLFFSTDLVFDGRQGDYHETDAVNPLSVYGETKAAAEEVVLANPKHTVVRTSINGGVSPGGDRAFNEKLRLAFEQGDLLRLFVDEFRNPIPAVVTARAVWELATGNRRGLYHVAGSERLSRLQLGRLIAARRPQWHPRIEAISIREFQGMPRAADTTLNCAKAQKLLSFPLPCLSEWLAAHPDEPF